MSGASLRPPWNDLARQNQATSFGMWVFLASEVLLFAGLFAGFAVYRNQFPAGFLAAGRQTDIIFGTVNTALLMTSSLAIAVAGRAARIGLYGWTRGLLLTTVALGATFLVLKGFEYREDIAKHLIPGPAFPLTEPGASLFFSFYWVMTGVHALHMTGGIVAVLALLAASRKDARWLADSGIEEAVALYWHLVDVIWIVLYPLLYLGGRSYG